MFGQEKWSRSDFIFKRQLGMGQFGVVYQAVERNSYFPVAIKIIPKNKVNSQTLYKRLKRQLEIHSRLKYQYICNLYGYFTDQNHIYLVLEYCKNGNLYMPVKQLKQKVTERKIASIISQLLSAIAYLSVRHVMHRDIKLQNILFDENFNVKLTDFGCSVHSISNRKTVCGTIEYLCPQMINEEVYDHDVDLYCLGIVTYELFYFQSPFYDKQEEEIYKNIKEGVIIFDQNIRIIPESAKDLINVLLKSSPKPKPIELMEHSFFKQYLVHERHLEEENAILYGQIL